jgi:2-polyprenyl-3-methyl-5-hydroxy-6-metoxy-1,4-benzoquinol methylase
MTTSDRTTEAKARPFNDDVAENEGYRYTTNASLSSEMANERLTAETLARLDLAGRRVLDVGCGDGVYTEQLLLRGRPAVIVGTDLAADAIELAQRRFAGRDGLRFAVNDIYSTPELGHFDVAVVRGVLHHVPDPAPAIAAVARACDELLIIEPNGYNPVLKVIEKVSPYHREHEERSYPPFRLRRWVRDAGFAIDHAAYAGLVPFFCPDAAARALKRVEPLVERSPLAAISCAVHVVRARRR